MQGAGRWGMESVLGGADFFTSPALCDITARHHPHGEKIISVDMAALLGSGYSSYVTDMIRWVGLGVRLGH